MLNPASCRAVDEESPAGTTRRYPGLRSAGASPHSLLVNSILLFVMYDVQPASRTS